MIIGFYGPLANNTYVAAKSFHKMGYKVYFIKDFSDLFPFSQPVWEDKEFTLPFEKTHPYEWSQDLWLEKEKELGWTAKDFVHSCYHEVEANEIKKRSFFEKIKNKFLYLTSNRQRLVLDKMRNTDFLIVCGIEASILALLSKKPYVIWPHGGDIRSASNFSILTHIFSKKLFSGPEPLLLNKAYRNAKFIGSSDPDGGGGHLTKIKYKIDYFPLPMNLKFKKNNNKYKGNRLIKLFSKHNISIPKDKIYIFIPSRVDFFWKGTDLLIQAIKKSKPTKIHFIFSGWGQDYQKAKSQLSKYDVTFLPFTMSKKLLYKIYSNVSLVIDQFYFSYGTSALEAMSVGTPVMMNIDNKAYLNKGWLPPPVINVKKIDQISLILKQIDKGSFPLKKYSERTIEWFKKTHCEDISVPRIMKKIESNILGLKFD